MKPIAVFDSGVGGLTVLHQAMKVLPDESYFYFADTDNLPYGTKSVSQIRKLVLEYVEFIDGFHPKLLLVACNTATSVVINELRAFYSFPIIGMEPAIKPASELGSSKRILVTATDRTLQENKLDELISGLNIEDRVDKLSLQELVFFAENKDFISDQLHDYLKGKLEHLDWSAYNSIVLGCTHFIYFKNLIKNFVPESVQIIDGNKGTINRLIEILPFQNEDGVELRFYKSKINADWSQIESYFKYLDSQFHNTF